MKQILIATHGKMASGIRYTAELIVGKMAEITTIDAYVTPEDNVEKKFEEYFAQHENDRIFVFTDLMGGSVNQKLLGYSQKENVTLITGTNLPVLMQVMMADDDVTEDEIREFIDDAREELQVVDLGGEKKSTVEKNAEEDTAQISEGAASYAKKSAPKKAPAPQSYDNSTAKITALRVDDRLIHGQVAMTWTKQLAVQGIVVANDEAANDNTQKMALKMAVPGGIKSLIKPVDEAIRILNNPKASRMRILVLTRTVKDALKIRQSVGEIGFLNVGNTGRFDGIDVSEKLVLTPTIMLTKAEQQALKELVALDPKACMQQVPNDEQKLVKDILDKLD
ncbi:MULTISPECIES: PTS mannose/fructose/sorbose transporter subunit IIAB [Blautia]|jgi:mannose PTS system EIIAB component|uniref:PTS mannose/fructose/sorbose transporter subunit IIAB n=1 Tax=Blautia TaxID=572511 RepID=UPI0022E90B16|nr:PTS mannose/fructose/sorbose transporter subunit IIAB [Blautia massiliensis (ex Durand et al. 2017)]